MWHENLLLLFKESGLTKHEVAERGNLPYDTVKRIIKGTTFNPSVETLISLARGLNCTVDDICVGTGAVIGTKALSELQSTIDSLTSEKESVIAERDLVVAKNDILENKVAALTAEIDLLKMQLMHKEELLAVHNYYIKLNK